MPVLVIYLDTSVASAYFDERDPPRMLATRGFWGNLSNHDVLISDLVVREVRHTPDQVRRQAIEDLLRQFTVVPIDDEMRALASRYLQSGVFVPTAGADALHVAACTVVGADLVVNWNFQHMVKVRTIQRVNSVNLDLGYRPIDIRSPLEL